MAQEDKPIRVVDRRMFTPDGQLRPDFEADEPAGPAVPPAAAPPAPPAHESAGARAEGRAERVASPSFLSLVSFVASNVYAALGVDPMTGERLNRREPAAARQMIDWLVTLEQKTRGNLAFEESDLLGKVLYELRLAYVEAVRPPGGERSP